MSTLFDKDYYENGIECGVSCYENYHWLGQSTIEYCKHIVDWLELNEDTNLLDFGCAKGCYVKAFRMLGIEAFGSDASLYAIENSLLETHQWLLHTNGKSVWPSLSCNFDVVFCKDTLEHIEDLRPVLESIAHHCKTALIGVPLADEKTGKYRIERAERDKTHIHRFDEYRWNTLFLKYFKSVEIHYSIPGVLPKEGDDSKGYGYFRMSH